MPDTTAFISYLGEVFGGFVTSELLLLFRENLTNPLTWSLLAKLDIIPVTQRIRRYMLNGDSSEDAKQAWHLKESYKDTFAMEAVAVSPLGSVEIQ